MSPDSGAVSRCGTGGWDRGSASVWLLAVGLVLVAAGLAGAAVGAAHVASHRAQSAADLGALAGAARAIEGPDAACARADEIVSANGARLTGCRLDGLDLTITVEVTPAAAAGRGMVATATARAGPVRADATEEDLLTLADVADRAGRSRESVRRYAAGERGGGGFPAPVNPDHEGALFYRWSEVGPWLRERLGIDVDASNRVPVVANLLLQARQHRHHAEQMPTLAGLLAA